MLYLFFFLVTTLPPIAAIALWHAAPRLANRALWATIAISCVVAGGILGIIECRELERQIARQKWPTAEGVVVESRVGGERAYHPEVVFTYSVGGTTYIDTTDYGHPGFGAKRSRLASAEIIVGSHRPGGKVAVHYDPRNPKIAVVRPGPEWFTLTRLGFGGCLFASGVFLLSWLIVAERRRRYVS